MIEGEAAKRFKADPRLLIAYQRWTAKRAPADMVIAREFDRQQQLEPLPRWLLPRVIDSRDHQFGAC